MIHSHTRASPNVIERCTGYRGGRLSVGHRLCCTDGPGAAAVAVAGDSGEQTLVLLQGGREELGTEGGKETVQTVCMTVGLWECGV